MKWPVSFPWCLCCSFVCMHCHFLFFVSASGICIVRFYFIYLCFSFNMPPLGNLFSHSLFLTLPLSLSPFLSHTPTPTFSLPHIPTLFSLDCIRTFQRIILIRQFSREIQKSFIILFPFLHLKRQLFKMIKL